MKYTVEIRIAGTLSRVKRQSTVVGPMVELECVL